MATNTNKICFKSAGMIMTLILYPLTIINIILSRYDYQQTYLNWFSGTGFRVFGVVQLSTVIIAFASATIAFFVFSCWSDNKGAIFLLILFNGLSMLLTLSTSIFSIVSGSFGGIERYLGCNSEYKGLIKKWENLDKYFKEVDSILCSTSCPCYMNPITVKIFENEPSAKTTLNNFFNYNQDKANSAVNIQECISKHSDVKERLNTFVKENLKTTLKDFDIEKFNKYWKRIEKKFKCSGFCSTIYSSDGSLGDTSLPNQRPMIKYMFTDVNKGVVEHRGCLERMLVWIQKMLFSFGVLGILSSCSQIGMFICSIGIIAIEINKIIQLEVDIKKQQVMIQ